MMAFSFSGAAAATRLAGSHPSAGLLLLPALNNMIDVATTREMALQIHPPGVVCVLLFGPALVCSALAGYRMSGGQRRSWLHILGFTVVTVVIVYVTLDVTRAVAYSTSSPQIRC